MSYMFAGYGVTAAALVAYAARLVWRRRSLARLLDGEGR